MTTTKLMLDTYPKPLDVDRDKLAAAIDALIACARVCTACADACLAEDMVAELTGCIGTNLDCADVCGVTARVLSRHTGDDARLRRGLLEACVMACSICADECGKHADMHEHCGICTDACLTCEQACRDLLAAIG